MNGDHYVGLRAALGVLLPLLVLIALGRLDLAPYAVFGAFVGVYSRVPGHLDRLLMQIKSGGLMWFVLLAAWFAGEYLVRGATSPAGVTALVTLTALVAGGASVAAGFLRLRPAGPLFQIFAFAAIASMPNQPSLSEGMFTATAVIIFALVLGQLGRVAPLRRTTWQVVPTPVIPASAKRAIWLESAAFLVASGVAGAAAALLAGPLHIGHTYWAMVAAVVPLAGRSTRMRMIRAVHRILGTAAGLVVMTAIVLLQPEPWLAVLLIGVMQFLTEIFIARNYFWAMVFVTPLALVGTALGKVLTLDIVYDRAVETLIGVIVGVLAVLVINAFASKGPHRVHVVNPT